MDVGVGVGVGEKILSWFILLCMGGQHGRRMPCARSFMLVEWPRNTHEAAALSFFPLCGVGGDSPHGTRGEWALLGHCFACTSPRRKCMCYILELVHLKVCEKTLMYHGRVFKGE